MSCDKLNSDLKKKSICYLNENIYNIKCLCSFSRAAVNGEISTIPLTTVSRLYTVYDHLSHDIVSGSHIMPCNKIDKPLVVYRFSNVTN